VELDNGIEAVLSSYGIGWCHFEVIKALSVLVRSEMMQRIPSSRYYNPQKSPVMIDSESGDLSAIRDEVLKEAVESTQGLIAVNGDKAVDVFFTRCCGGATASSEDIKGIRINYLRRVVCRHCQEIIKERTVNIGDIIRRLDVARPAYKDSIDCIFQNVVRDQEGRIITIDVMNTRMTGEQFMECFHVESNRIYFLEDSISLKVCGDGTGLGICLMGANSLAESGMDFEGIIKYYYTDVMLHQIDQSILSSSLNGERIIIDPGHGGGDRGNYFGDIYEKDANLSIALKLKERLELSGGNAILTRETDSDVSVSTRLSLINSIRPKFYVSIHQNSFFSNKVNGAECYCFDGDDEAMKLGRFICQGIESESGIKNRGVRVGDYYMLREGKVSGLIVECMYMSGDMDNRMYNDEGYKRIAGGIFKGICMYYNIIPV
jgi:SpoIID/LytB domain protein